jgi:uncharacterized protein involved in type VI secretion and phage assembly
MPTEIQEQVVHADSDFQLTNTTVKVESNDDNITFSNLVINQYLADVNNFSFTWREEKSDSKFSDQVTFYKTNLSKQVTITIHDNFTFKGIISSIHCNKLDTLGVEYEIMGKGLLMKLDKVIECNSFYKKKLSDIFKEKLSAVSAATSSIYSDSSETELHYTVQYNQTAFEYFRLMAARYGSWLYYTGELLSTTPPPKDALSLAAGKDISNLHFNASINNTPNAGIGFDTVKGEALNSNSQSSSSNASLVDAGMQGGKNVFGNTTPNINFTHAETQAVLDNFNTLQQKAAAAKTVFITCSSFNSKIKLAGRIKLTDENNDSLGDYVVTEIHHFCSTDNSYQNQITAVPAENEVPPYTNPYLFPRMNAQPALVIDNEDKDGLDRIKVQFPWQKSSDYSPWVTMLTPHAGKDKGFRFLPEKEEEVMIDFIDGNAEKPYIIGAFYTDKNKSGVDQTNNNIKSIGTKTGRSIIIDDDKGIVGFRDNLPNEYSKNRIVLYRDSSSAFMNIQSSKDDNNSSLISLDDDGRIGLEVISGGKTVAYVGLQTDPVKITISSKGSIDISADQEINMKAATINIKASQTLNLEGTADSVNIKGMQVNAKADTAMDLESGTQMQVKGLMVDITGNANAKLEGGITTIKGGIVMIN